MDIALQITPTGLTYALKPVSASGEEVVGMYVRWPSPAGAHSRRPSTGQQATLVKKMIARMLTNAAAEAALLAIEEGTAQYRIDAVRAALDQENCIVGERTAHADGAMGLMREWLGQTTDTDTGIRPLQPPRGRKRGGT
ncbi:hypothetical protein [Aliihoeflea sp. PC F10.4]